jgi:hypothetical protein
MEERKGVIVKFVRPKLVRTSLLFCFCFFNRRDHEIEEGGWSRKRMLGNVRVDILRTNYIKPYAKAEEVILPKATTL